MAKPNASSKMDLPEPVSPVNTHKPLSKCIFSLSIKTILFILKLSNNSNKYFLHM